jgi:MFS family permease
LSPLSVLARNRDFRHLFAAELVMFGGDWFVMVPLLVLLPRLTGSGLWGGLVLTADTGIQALLLPFTGTVADRIDRRRIMLVASVAGVVAVLALLLVRSPGNAWIAPVAVASPRPCCWCGRSAVRCRSVPRGRRRAPSARSVRRSDTSGGGPGSRRW